MVADAILSDSGKYIYDAFICTYIYSNLNNIAGKSVLAVKNVNLYSLLGVAILLLASFRVEFFYGPVMDNIYQFAG